MKTLKSRFQLVILALAAMVLISSCKKDDEGDQPMQSRNIVEIASSDPDFSILVDALVKADLVSTLEGPGPFTVFAPNNTAFEMLFTDLGINGIDDLSKEVLTPILLYHVIGASYKSSALANGYISTLNTNAPDNNHVLMYTETGDMVKINGTSMVATADIEASNGFIHVVDKVILPATIADLAVANPDFSILVSAISRTGLLDAVNAPGPFTVFAPTNAAFEALFADLGISSIDDVPVDQLTSIILYHVVEGNVRSDQVMTGMVPTLLPDANLDIMVDNSGVMINGSTKVVAVDVQGTNGVVHALDNVLLPPAN